MHSKLILTGNLTACLLILTSCSGRKSQYADVIMHSSSYTASPMSSSYTLPEKGKVLTIERAVEIAIANNPGIGIAQLKATAASAQYYGSFSSLPPAISADKTGNISAVYADANRWNAINAQMNILSKKENMLSAKEMSANTQRLLSLQTAIAYDTILSDKNEILIKLQNKAFYDEALKNIETGKRTGQNSREDILQLKTEAYAAQSSLIQSINKFNNDKTALAVLMGLPNAEMPKNIIFPEKEITHKDKLESVDSYLDTALQMRPDLKAAKADVKESEYNLYSSYAELAPASDIAASQNTLSTSTQANLNPLPETANIINAQAAEDIADEKLIQDYIQVQNSTRSAYNSLSSSRAEEKIISEQTGTAKENRDIIKARFDQGLATIDELNQAQNNYINTLLLFNKAIINEASSRAALDAAVGMPGF